MKLTRIIPLFALALVIAPLASAADFGVRAGQYQDADEEFVGAEMLFDLGSVNINPNIEYSLAEDITAGTANVDVTVDVFSVNRFTPYIGAGVGLAYTDTDFGDDTEILGNLIGGVSWNLDFLTPYAQVKYFRGIDGDDAEDNDDIALTIGLRF